MALDALVLAGLLNFVAAIAHIGVILGGARWYRFFGAGEKMAALAEAGSVKPTVITLFIAVVLCTWGIIAFAGAGIFPALPYTKWLLVGIMVIYLLRGLAGLILPFTLKHPVIQENSKSFWLVSSIVCLFFALVHFVGLNAQWRYL